MLKNIQIIQKESEKREGRKKKIKMGDTEKQ